MATPTFGKAITDIATLDNGEMQITCIRYTQAGKVRTDRWYAPSQKPVSLPQQPLLLCAVNPRPVVEDTVMEFIPSDESVISLYATVEDTRAATRIQLTFGFLDTRYTWPIPPDRALAPIPTLRPTPMVRTTTLPLLPVEARALDPVHC